MRLTKRESVLLCILAVLVVAVGYYYFFWMGWNARETELNGRILTLEAEIRDEQSRMSTLPLVRGELERLEARRDELVGGAPFTPVRDEIPRLLAQIMPSEAAYDLSMETITGEYHTTVSVYLGVKGPSGTFRELLGKLAGGGIPCAVRSADMSASGSGEAVSLRLDFLYLNPEAITPVFTEQTQ